MFGEGEFPHEHCGIKTDADVQRHWAAYTDASVCVRCGRTLAADEPVWLLRCRLLWQHGVTGDILVLRQDDRAAGCAACAEEQWQRCQSYDRWGVHANARSGPCPGCNRTVHLMGTLYQTDRGFLCASLFCSNRCRNKVHAARWRARHPQARKKPRAVLTCPACGKSFVASRKDARACSARCRQKLYRDRHRGVTDGR
jgi:predicted nucleic acid-binding Zn ribbon protein